MAGLDVKFSLRDNKMYQQESFVSRVLIVEDDDDIRSTIEEKLKILGFQIDSCNRAENLPPKLNGNPPDIILLDIMLPGKDGKEIARDLKANSETSSIPIIAVSGTPDIGEPRKYLELGFADTCPKPINYTDLMMKIARILGLQ